MKSSKKLIKYSLVVIVTCVLLVLAKEILKIEFKAKESQSVEYSGNVSDNRIGALLHVFKAYDEQGEIKLIRVGRNNDGGYVVPEKSLLLADALMGYGIARDNSFEIAFAKNYAKPSYGFDCGGNRAKEKYYLYKFVNECIGSDSSLYSNRRSSKRITSLTEQVTKFNLQGKKLFIKMDIEGSEYQALANILENNAKNITAIVFEFHDYPYRAEETIKVLSSFNKDFVLLHIHPNNHLPLVFSAKNIKGSLPKNLELTYLNKSLTTRFEKIKEKTYPIADLDMPSNFRGPDPIFTIFSAD